MTRGAHLVAALVAAIAVSPACAGWWDEAASARTATLDDVRRDPDPWRDVVVLLEVRFARVEEIATSSRFAAEDWRAMRVLAADAADDAPASAEAPGALLLRRGSLVAERVMTLQRGQRVQVRATVREVAEGEPRLEVFAVVGDEDPLTAEESALCARGEHLLAHENPRAAEACFRELLEHRKLPRTARADVERKIGAACWAQRRFAEAMSAYTEALAVDPDDTFSAARLAAAREALADRHAPDAAPSVATTPPAPPRHLLPPAGLPAQVRDAPTDLPPPKPVLVSPR